MHEPDILIDTKASLCESDYTITQTCIRQATNMQTEKDFQRDLFKINRASCLMEVSYADSCYIAQKKGNVSVRKKIFCLHVDDGIQQYSCVISLLRNSVYTD